MTEQEWLECDDPAAMLRWLRQATRPVHLRVRATQYSLPSDRKLRLWFCNTVRLNADSFYRQEEVAALLRDVVGNPFRPCDFHMPGWSRERHPAWDQSHTLAAVAYDERDPATGHIDPHRLLVLSDALEEAGCDDADLLLHLRGQQRCPLYYGASGGPEDCAVCGARRSIDHGWVTLTGPHVRGCWALDLLLGKE